MNGRLAYWLVICIALNFSCFSCGRSAENYKVEADGEVYSIIDGKWQEDFGKKVNYKISDTAPLPDDLQVEKAVPPSGVLTLAQAVKLATAHNRLYQTERELLYVKALDLTLLRHQYVPNFFGGARGQYIKDGTDEAIGGEAGLGVGRFEQLLSTGATISTRIAAAWVSVITGDMRSGLSSIFNATVTQPLLRGRGSKIALENLTQAQRDTLYQIRFFNRFRKTFVVTIASQYYWVLQSFDALKNARQNHKTLVWVHERAIKLAKAGRIPEYELDQAEQDKLRAWDEVVQNVKEYEQLLDLFKIELGLSSTLELRLDEKELQALKAIGTVEHDFPETEAIETALHQRLDLDNSADMVADAERKVEVAADGLGTELNLIANTEIDTLNSINNMLGVGLELDLPIDRLAERNIYRMALITLTQRQRELEEASDRAELEVRQAFRDLREAAERHRVQLESLKLAQKRFNNTFLLLQYRRANTRDVLDAQGDMHRPQDEATDALVDYTIATLNFYRDTGILQVRPDGMWQYAVSAAQ